MTTMEKLPEDVLVNIMKRLLAKQLAQMRSISKYWNAFLSQPFFIKSHLHRSIRSNEQVLLLFDILSDSQPFTEIPDTYVSDFIKAPVNPRTESGKGMRVIGAVNGLICSSYDHHSVVHIWNPSLSAVLTLPPSSMPSYSDDYSNIKTHLRFGFDPKTDDYKVVKLTGLRKPKLKYSRAGRWLPVEIYSMRKGSWEVITERFPSRVTFLYNGDEVCVDGLLHWLGVIDKKMSLRTIVAFDMGTHTFREMPFPYLDTDIASLIVLSGKFGVMSRDYVTDVIEVWVMEEYGVAESWAKRHVFPQFPQFPYGFTSRGELLVAGSCYLVLYDPIEKKQIWVQDFSPKYCDADRIVEYLDSLVWITPQSDGLVVDGGQISL